MKKILDKSSIMAIILVALILLVALFMDKCSPSAPPTEEPGVSLIGNTGYQPYDAMSNVKLQGTSGITIRNKKIEFEFKNDKTNVYNMVVVILLGDGKEVYHSYSLLPGTSDFNPVTGLELAPGIYKNSVIVYKIYDKVGHFVTQCEFPVEISVIN